MKVITLWQPWASLIAVGAKKFEKRTWGTAYRGLLAIHASKKKPSDILRGIDIRIIKKMGQAFGRDDPDNFKKVIAYMDTLPRGAVTATGELVGCWEISNYTRYGCVSIGVYSDIIISPNSNEYMFGDWRPGRFAWEIADVKKLDKPIPARGAQGLWDWHDPELEA